MQDQLLGADQIQQVIAQWEPEAVVGEAAQLIAPVLFEVYPDALDLLELATPTLIQGLAQSIDSIELVYLRGNDAWQKRKRIRTV
jgi:tRNA A37 threonylcarbamoyladenosine modification protein TsaB